jgi:hypothetical protein
MSRYHRAQLVDRQGGTPCCPRRGALYRRLWQRVLPEHQRHDVQHHCRLARTPPGRFFRQPMLHSNPPNLHPGFGRIPIQTHPDVRIAPQRWRCLGTKIGQRPPDRPRQIAEADRDYYLERRYPAFGNLVPRDIASRAAKVACDEGLGVGKSPASPCTLTLPMPSNARAKPPWKPPMATCSRCMKKLPATTLRGAHADLPRRALYHGRTLGGLRTDDHDSRACTLVVKPISATTAPTASVHLP